jgi:F-type H+-transporting ATPase subunit b
MSFDWWTLGLQTINVVVLIWLLQRFFWRPVAKIIAERRALADKTLADAKAQSAKVGTGLADIAKTRAGFASERAVILADAHSEAEKAKAALIDRASRDAEGLEVAAKTRIEAEREAEAKDWGRRSNDLGIDIARRLAGRLDGSAVRTVFLDWLVTAIAALPDTVRQAALLQGMPFEAVSATPLNAADQSHASELIGKAFGGNPTIHYSTDPALIAGLELRGSHLIVGNSWQADLAKIQAELSNDRHG